MIVPETEDQGAATIAAQQQQQQQQPSVGAAAAAAAAEAVAAAEQGQAREQRQLAREQRRQAQEQAQQAQQAEQQGSGQAAPDGNRGEESESGDEAEEQEEGRQAETALLRFAAHLCEAEIRGELLCGFGSCCAACSLPVGCRFVQGRKCGITCMPAVASPHARRAWSGQADCCCRCVCVQVPSPPPVEWTCFTSGPTGCRRLCPPASELCGWQRRWGGVCSHLRAGLANLCRAALANKQPSAQVHACNSIVPSRPLPRRLLAMAQEGRDDPVRRELAKVAMFYESKTRRSKDSQKKRGGGR